MWHFCLQQLTCKAMVLNIKRLPCADNSQDCHTLCKRLLPVQWPPVHDGTTATGCAEIALLKRSALKLAVHFSASEH